jgi:hypothetical protein
MLKHILYTLAIACLMLAASAPLQAQAQGNDQTVYTYVSQFQVPRASWTQFAADTDRTAKPILQRLLADGTISSWGLFENIVHTADGMTNGSWWQSSSLAGITRVLDELRKAGPSSGQLASTKHEDYLLRTVEHWGHAGNQSSGYLRVVSVSTQPGKADEYLEAVKKYLVPTFDQQLKNGNLISWSYDTQFVNTGPPSGRSLVFLYPDATTMDKAVTAVIGTINNMSPDDKKGWQDALAATTVADSRRDFMARITSSAHK